jgi:phosphotransferase system IIA component
MVRQGQLIYCVFIRGYMFRPVCRLKHVACDNTINQLCLTYHCSTLLVLSHRDVFHHIGSITIRLIGKSFFHKVLRLI